MSWDTRVVPEAIIVYFVRCSTCNLNLECRSESEAERYRAAHWRAHDERYAADEMDLGYDLNPDPETQRRPVSLNVNRCRLVNPLCPEDLCELSENHPGSLAGRHLLGTMSEPGVVSDLMYLSRSSHTTEELIAEGARAAEEMA